MIAGHVSCIYNLKGFDCAAHIRFGAGVERISHPDIGYQRFRAAGWSRGSGRDRNHCRDIQLDRSLQSSCLHVHVERFVGGMPEAEHNGRPGQHSFFQDELEISRSFGAGGGGGDAIGCCDCDVCQGHFLLGISIALDDCTFNRHRLPDMDRSHPVRAQDQPKDYGCRNCDDRPDNFLCRHATPIDSWTHNISYMLPTGRSSGRVCASINSANVSPCIGFGATSNGMIKHG